MRRALLVLMPLRAEPSAQTALSLAENMDGLEHRILIERGKPVDEARNALAARVVGDEALTDDDLCLWIDDDCYCCSGSVRLMIETFGRAQVDVLTAYFGPRAPFATPLSMLKPNVYPSAPREGIDFRLGEVIPIASASMKFVMHRRVLLTQLGEKPFTPLPGSLGEDHSFFERIRLRGRRAALATGIVVAHCENDLAFVPGRRPFRIIGNKLAKAGDPRTDAEYAGRNLRRSYGPAVDALISPFTQRP